MMYSFMCSEEQTTLCTSDILPTKDTILSSIISVSVHPGLFVGPNSTVVLDALTENTGHDTGVEVSPPTNTRTETQSTVLMHCKLNNSSLDMLLGNSNNCCGNQMNLIGIPSKDLGSFLRISRSMVNIDTCRVYCKCGEHIGDGVFDTSGGGSMIDVSGGSQCVDENCVRDHNTGLPESALNTKIELSDLCDVRLLGNRVKIQHSRKNNAVDADTANVNRMRSSCGDENSRDSCVLVNASVVCI